MHSLTFHGGRLDEAAARFPDAPPWLDLSTGINPFAWAVEGVGPIDQRRLPSPTGLAALERAASRMFGADGLAVAAVPGSEIGLRLIARLDLPKPWRIVAPNYRTHQDALPCAEAIDTTTLASDAARGGTVMLANPNNPDGALYAPEALLALARTLRSAGGVLVVDEAFADAVPGASLLPLMSPEDRVLIFRSFGKFFGLAGVRLGFACGAADLVAGIAGQLGSWPVSAAAIAIGTAAYADAAWIDATRLRLPDACAVLDEVLRWHGFAPRGACPLFRLIETADAGAIFERLGRAGILARPFDYAPHWLRIGLPGRPDEVARLDEALRRR
jgi:cobalamin biosynthetic protein CobC